MKPKIINSVLTAVGTLLLAHSALAQPAGQTNYNWSAGGDQITWSQTANWLQGVVPPTDGTTYQIAVESGYPASDHNPITMQKSDVALLNDSMFGPDWGETMNCQGKIIAGFGLFIWGDATGVTTVNLRSNAVYTANDTIALGTAWWFPGGPNAVLNVYDNASVSCNYLQFGAQLNLYGGSVSVTNAFNTGTANSPIFSGGLDTDATRSINLAGGILILPGSYTAAVNDWISRGILKVYGKTNDYTDIIIDEANATYPGRTVVSSTTLGPLVAIHLQLARTNLVNGTFQQATVLADYANSTGVNITGLPGTTITYNSTATSVVTVNTNGLVRTVGLGNATVSAVVGSFTSSLAVTVSAPSTTLIHRYSFNDSPAGTTVADSIGGPAWAGTLNGGATLTGSQLSLDGSSGFVQLPAGVVTNLDAVTIEAWVSFGSPLNTWACLYAFGNTDGGTGSGQNYITCQPHTYYNTTQIGLSDADPGNSHEQDAYFNGVMDGQNNVHLVAVYHPFAGYSAIYINGALAAINKNVSIPLASALGADPLNYIGQSLYSVDPYLAANVDEFRIYSGALTQAQVTASDETGPNTVNITPGNLLGIYFASAQTNLAVRGTYAPAIYANYQYATNVPIANESALGLASSNTNAVLIVANQLQAGAIGSSATITATYQGQTATQSVTIIRPLAVLQHRWSFSETSGTTAHDSVGGADGTLQGSATFTGSGYVNLPNPGSNPQTGNSYVQIPGGLLNSLSAVTVECWVTNNGWNNGNTFVGFSGPIDANSFGTNYINFYARMYSTISAFEISTPSGDSGLEALGTRVNDNGVASGIPSHYTFVYDPTTSHSITLYTNGLLAGTQTGVTIPLSSLGTNVGTIGLSVYNQSQAYTLTQNGGSKINCPYINGGISEVRIYNGVFAAADAAATQALGPDLTLGSSTGVTLHATTVGGNVVLTWPTSAAPFAVLSSPSLGASAVWTPVSSPLSVNGGNYQVTVPQSSASQFFRLQLQ